MNKTRYFNDDICDKLARKPQDGKDLPLVQLPFKMGTCNYPAYRVADSRTPLKAIEEAITDGTIQHVHFIATVGDTNYVVNTEGFEYPRYAAVLAE